MDGNSDNKPNSQDAVDSIVLEEEIDPNYVPSEPEVVEYAKWMGMDLDKDQDLFWIAREGLMAPLPKDWKPCRTKDTEDIYYFNFSTGDSTWDHPCDGYYKRLYEEEKKKKETVIKESGDQNRSKAKQDVEQLLGKADKKKSKKVIRTLSEIDMVKALPAPLGLQKAPLPGINNPLRMSAPSSLGPLSSGGVSSSDALGSISKKNGLLRGSELDAKVASSLDGPRLVSSRDPSPLGRIPLDSADTKGIGLTVRQRVEQKDREEDVRESESDIDRNLGGLDVTSSLSSKSRMLGGSSAAASKLRAALPGATTVDDAGEQVRHSPSEEKYVDADWPDSKAAGEKVDGESYTDVRSNKMPRSETVPMPGGPQNASSTASALAEVERYKSRCSELERRAEENEARVADYKASYGAAKDDLLALERRYETNQSQWLDRVRALEVEMDKVESERRQLKLALLDLESSVKPVTQPSAPDREAEEALRSENRRLEDRVRALEVEKDKVESERRQLKLALLDLESSVKPVTQPSASGRETEEALRTENGRLQEEVTAVRAQLLSLEEALARSAAAFTDLQSSTNTVIAGAELRASQLESQRSVALAAKTDFAKMLDECKRELLEARLAVSTAVTAAPTISVDVSASEAEVKWLRASLSEAEARCSNAVKASKESSDEALQAERSRSTALHHELTSALASARAEFEKQALNNDKYVGDLVGRAEIAETSLRTADATIFGLRVAEASLKSDLGEKEKKISDQQEQILALQASNNISTSSDNEKSAQFEVFVSQATAIRKSLKSEIERQKAQILELESEKSNLVTQLTRQETTLQFAKKELNGVASLTESNRQLDIDKQQLAGQLETARASLTRQAEQEFQLREKYEQVLQTRHEEGELTRALRQENERLVLTLEQERTLGTQSEKKIKSYQEELLQLQRRLAEKASPAKSSRGAAEEANNLPASPTLFVDQSAEVLELQNRLSSQQTELDRVERDLVESTSALRASKEQVLQSQRTVDALSAKVSSLQDQLRAAALKVSDLGSDQAGLFKASMEERDRLEMEKMSLESQLQVLRAAVSTSQANLEFTIINVQRLEAEVKKYREKWLASEKELTDARVALGADSAGSNTAIDVLRAELREAHEAAQLYAATEDTLRLQVGALRKSLDDQTATVKDLRSGALRVAGPQENKENVQQHGSHPAPAGRGSDWSAAPSLELGRDPPHVPVQQHGLSQQHIVALSLEVGRQQATMERLEQHIRNTEVVLHEIKSQGRAAGPASPVPRKHRGAADRPEEAALDSSTPDSQQSLLIGRASGREGDSVGSSSPARRVRSRQLQQQRAAKSVQFQVTAKDKDRRRSADANAAAGLLDLMDLRDQVAALVEEMDMDVHDRTTLTGLQLSRGLASPPMHLVGPTAQRVLTEGKTRLRKEAKFLKEVQALCLSAKDSISHNQECVKSLKAAWRNAKSDHRGGTSSSGLTTERVNSITLKVNSAVDELRETQQLTKNRENRSKSLHQSVQYLEQLLGQGGEEAQHLIEIMQLVQEKCVESAAELEALVRTCRTKGRPAPSSSRASDRTSERAVVAASGVAFSEPIMKEGHFGHAGAPPTTNLFAPTFPQQSAPLQYPPSSSPGRPAYFSALNSVFSAGVPHTATTSSSSASVSVSGMRNSDLKNRLLQEQIAKITERQSLSKAVCEKHAGWLSDLGKEISGAVHVGVAASSSSSFTFSSAAVGRSTAASSEPFAASLQSYKAKYAGKQDDLSAAQSRSFGTALHNQQQQRVDVTDSLLQNL